MDGGGKERVVACAFSFEHTAFNSGVSKRFCKPVSRFCGNAASVRGNEHFACGHATYYLSPNIVYRIIAWGAVKSVVFQPRILEVEAVCYRVGASEIQ